MIELHHVYLVLSISILASASLIKGSPSCAEDLDCGWNSVCYQAQCGCRRGFTLGDNGRDCLDTYCGVEHCLECLGEDTCHRCVDYIEENTGRCLEACNGPYSLVIEGSQVGKLCRESRGSLNLTYVGIIIALCAAVVLTILVSLVFCWKLRTDREKDAKMKLLQDEINYRKKSKTERETAQLTQHDSASYDGNDAHEDRMKRLHFLHQVALLRPHVDTLLVMLTEARRKLNGLKCLNSPQRSDNREFVYRNIIDQLCRALTILNRPEPAMPLDGILLLDWAERMLKEYLKTQQTPSPVSTGSNTGSRDNLLTSTFKPELALIPNGKQPYHHHHQSLPQPDQLFAYQRYGELQHGEDVSDFGSRDRAKDFTNPVVV